MTSYARQAIILGLTVTLLVVGIELLGALGALERETIGLRFAHARWRNETMYDQIRFGDIDDGALDSVGRWPWPRSKLADAIDESRLAGAGSIAIDLILDETQDLEYRPRSVDPIDHDANLAEALRRKMSSSCMSRRFPFDLRPASPPSFVSTSVTSPLGSLRNMRPMSPG